MHQARAERSLPVSREDAPSVSIGMPVYNGERYLCGALDALLAQTHTDFELIICDNASTDTTPSICCEYAERDTRIRYVRHDAPVSTTENFNRVLALASGEHFMWAAHDDSWEPRFIEVLRAALRTNSRAVLAFCKFDNWDPDGNTSAVFDDDWRGVFSAEKFAQFLGLATRDESRTQKANHFYGLIRRETLVACGGMHASVSAYSGADVLTLLQLLARGDFVVVDQLLFHYRVRNSIPRGNQRLLQYLWSRIRGKAAGHRGNLLTHIRSDHDYYSAMRRIIWNEAPLSRVQRGAICAATLSRQFSRPLASISFALRKELLASSKRRGTAV
ncbi:MAG: glycosyltransferase family 2 protein [Polyangiaceae bacterium]